MPEPTSEQWLDLHQAFRDYCESKPWEWMDDTDLVAVEHPFGEYKGYCVVLGGGGIEYGLAVYNGDEGLAGYLEAVSGVNNVRAAHLIEPVTSSLSIQLSVGDTGQLYEIKQMMAEFF